MKLFSVFAMLVLFCSSPAFAEPYYRFWRGGKLAGLDAVRFEADLNRIFIPATVNQGKGKGLLAYQPVLPPIEKPDFIPDEFALVTYQSENGYRALKKMPVGAVYQKLHWSYFDRSRSKSLVPEEYRGEVALEKAYDLLKGNTDWQKGASFFSLFLRASAESNLQFVARINSYILNSKQQFVAGGLNSWVILVADGYAAEYQLWKTSAAREVALKACAFIPRKLQHMELEKREVPLKYGMGRNLIFSP